MEDDPTQNERPHEPIILDLPGPTLIRLAPILYVMSKLLIIASGVSKFAGIPLPTKCFRAMGLNKSKLKKLSDIFQTINKQQGSLDKANNILRDVSSCLQVGVNSDQGETKGGAAFHNREQ